MIFHVTNRCEELLAVDFNDEVEAMVSLGFQMNGNFIATNATSDQCSKTTVVIHILINCLNIVNCSGYSEIYIFADNLERKVKYKCL